MVSEKMNIDDKIQYIYDKIKQGYKFSIKELDEIVESCSVTDREAKEGALTLFYSGGEDDIINRSQFQEIQMSGLSEELMHTGY